VVGVDAAHDRRRFCVTENGITLVTPDMLGQNIYTVR
jgi:glucose-1-phosphate adenylyltransferase